MRPAKAGGAVPSRPPQVRLGQAALGAVWGPPRPPRPTAPPVPSTRPIASAPGVPGLTAKSGSPVAPGAFTKSRPGIKAPIPAVSKIPPAAPTHRDRPRFHIPKGAVKAAPGVFIPVAGGLPAAGNAAANPPGDPAELLPDPNDTPPSLSRYLGTGTDRSERRRGQLEATVSTPDGHGGGIGATGSASLLPGVGGGGTTYRR